MSGVTRHQVTADEADVRIDRWFKRHFPALSHGKLEKLLRTGQVRLDGARVKANQRLQPGQEIRVPPLDKLMSAAPTKRPPPPVDPRSAADLQDRVVFCDDQVIVLDKPPGLAVQGGSKQERHLDAMLDSLRFGAERPRLVHRLDKDTSGVLVLGRTAAAAAALAGAFRGKSARKLYWAMTAGVPPKPHQGRIDLALDKRPGAGGERVVAAAEGRRATTLYSVVATAARRAAWLALQPLTGRTHQLRVHCAHLGTPIVGDGKYGGADAFLTGAVSRKLHLHARAIVMPHPKGGIIRATAPLPDHMAQSWQLLGFEIEPEADRFLDELDAE